MKLFIEQNSSKLIYSSLFSIACLLIPIQTIAQVTSDGTLSTTVTSSDGRNFTIEDGARRGDNLFHSFQDFSVPDGGSASFNHVESIQNIFSRVTGGNISEINGLLEAQGSANLFLINPAGIIFGANAQLNVGGSFLATTAESILFADDKQFSATNPQSSSLLTVSVPIGLQFGSKVGRIENQALLFDESDFATGLEVTLQKTLALIGGEILIDGGVLKAPSGKVELASLGADSFVSFSSNSQGLIFDYRNVENFLDLVLSNQAEIVTTNSIELSIPSGSVSIHARRIDLKDTSFIFSINSSNEDGGSILISGEQLILQDNSQIEVSTDSDGKAGNIEIDVDRIELIGKERGEDLGVTAIFSQSVPFSETSTGDSGNIIIDTKQLVLRDGAEIRVSTLSEGKGGDLIINATESIEVIGQTADSQFFSGLLAQSEGENATGDAGNIEINTAKLTVRDGGQISVGAVESFNPFRPGISQGNGGELTINATESIEVSGFGLDERGEVLPSTLLSQSQGIGDAGNLTITTPNLTVTNGGEINVSATGAGEAGSLTIEAQNIVLNSGIFAAETRTGNQGNITINNADTLLLTNNSAITTNASEQATGGNITIDSEGITLLNGSSITANAIQGQGGNINITTERLFREPNTIIDASSAENIDGTVIINDPDVDPTSGTLEPTDVPVDAETILAQNLCSFEDGKIAQGSSLIVTGRGGLTPTSEDSLGNTTQIVDWANREEIAVSENGTVGVRQRVREEGLQSDRPIIQQSQGLATADDGSVWLVANAEEVTPQNMAIAHPDCQAS